MITQANARLAVGEALVAVAVFATMALTPAEPAEPAAHVAPSTAWACSLSIDGPIPVAPEQTTATIRFSSAIGDTLVATFPPDSRVEIVSIKRTRSDGPLTATITLATARATAGQWDVSVRGERGECTGKIGIGQGTIRKSAPPTACTAFIDDEIRIRKPHVQVLVTYTQDIGAPIAASISRGAKIEVVDANGLAGNQAISRWLALNTTNAVAGQWKLTVQGETRSCTGNLNVGAPLIPGGR